MRYIERMLVVIEAEAHGAFVIDKALALRDHAQASVTFAKIHYDHVVDDAALGLSADERERLVTLEVQAEQIKFERSIARHARDRDWCAEVVWGKQSWRSILDLAERGDCDLIVKDAYVERHLDRVVHTAHDWNLLRYAELPVLMVKPEQWVANAIVLAALDVAQRGNDELNKRILRYAADLTALLNGTLYVINALPVSRRVVMEQHRGEDYERFIGDASARRLAIMERLLDETRIRDARVQVAEGTPHAAIIETVATLGVELLVIGKSQPDVDEYLGTTSERLLHGVNCDVISIA